MEWTCSHFLVVGMQSPKLLVICHQTDVSLIFFHSLQCELSKPRYSNVSLDKIWGTTTQFNLIFTTMLDDGSIWYTTLAIQGALWGPVLSALCFHCLQWHSATWRMVPSVCFYDIFAGVIFITGQILPPNDGSHPLLLKQSHWIQRDNLWNKILLSL